MSLSLPLALNLLLQAYPFDVVFIYLLTLHYAAVQLSRGTSQGEREKKRAKRAGKEIAEDSKQSQSRDSKSKDTDSKSKDPKARGRSKSRDEPQSRDDSKSRDTTRDTRSMDTRSMDSGKSSASARSVETLDGQTELLESLVHAAHVHFFLFHCHIDFCKFLSDLLS